MAENRLIAENTLKSVAFPVLDEAQMAQVAGCIKAAPTHHPDGDVLFKAGDRAVKFYIVKTGAIDIIDSTGDEPKTLVTHGPGQFSGEVSQLTGTRAMVSAVARGDCELFEISPEALRQVLNQCPGLSDIILQAFIARRQLLRESPDFMGLRVIGSRYSPDTFRVRDFLSRNRVLFT
jgi:thioredoxin reductase (NADPH)